MEPTQDQHGNGELADAIGQLELPMALVDLADLTVKGVSDAALDRLRLPPEAVIGHPALDRVVEDDRANSALAFEALRSGAVDFYHTRRRLEVPPGVESLDSGWVQTVRFADKRYALVELAEHGAPQRPLAAYLGQEPVTMVIGIVDAAWVVTAVSSEVTTVLGLTADDIVGRPVLGAVAPDDLARLLDAGVSAHGSCSVAFNLRLRNGEGSWQALCCVLTAFAGTSDRCFMLIPTAERDPRAAVDRVKELEAHLTRIAAEVEASGILMRVGPLPDAARFPALRSLSLRQWEVLSRLLRGERVPTIAAELSVSQSTVRNHLTAIFERFGVHSQPELLALLRAGDGSSR